MVRVEDIAREAGVSKSTASRALRGHQAIHPATVSRVRAVAERLNYVPNHVASSLALQRTNTIVLFVNNLVTRQTDEFHDGIESVCAEHGYLLLLQKLDSDRTRRSRYLQLLRQRRVDGVIVVPDLVGVHADEIAQIRRWGIAVVQIDNRADGADADYVGADNAAGARAVAEHLIALGHRRTGVIAAVRPLSCINERIAAFQEALATRGLPPAAVVALEGEGDEARTLPAEPPEFGRLAAHRLLDSAEPPTALFSVSDPGALGVLRALRERGLDCPGDVAVTSFDDDVFAAYLETSLTTVHWPAFEIGRQAAALLIGRMSGKETGPPLHRLLPPQLIYRESTLGVPRRPPRPAAPPLGPSAAAGDPAGPTAF